jgi:release factor glutamine methyltransferase
MNELYRELRARLAAGLPWLADKPEETADSTLRALWLAASGTRVSAVAAMQAELPVLQPDGAQFKALQDLVEQRLAGAPLAHLTGRQHFMGMEMLADANALVPRRETELLARAAIDLASRPDTIAARPLVVDICTGSGNLALAIARQVPAARIFAADVSAAAIDLARRNAAHLGLAGRVDFRVGNLLAPFDTTRFLGCTDLVVCNPPYIATARTALMADEIAGHEPRLAFDGGPFGVAILMRLLDEAPRFLRCGGWLAFEVGQGQAAALVRRIERDGRYDELRVLEDEDGIARGILSRRH